MARPVTLVSLRQVIRVIDLHPKKLERESGLTGPQWLVMPSVPEGDSVTTGQIAREVLIGLTGAGEQMLQQAPTLLQERFIDRFGALEEWEQNLTLSWLQRVADMMKASDLDAAPLPDSRDEPLVNKV